MKFLKVIKGLIIIRLCETIICEENEFFKKAYKEYLEEII